MSDITYTRITPAGEEKCSLRNGDGMTIEEKEKAVSDFCGNFLSSNAGRCYGCPLDNGIDDCADRSDEENYDILFGNKFNFVKANPDDAVESDAVNHPNHYTQNGIECIAAIRASMTADGFMDYCKGNVLKYLWRWRDKGGAEDLRKARVYLDWLIEEADK